VTAGLGNVEMALSVKVAVKRLVETGVGGFAAVAAVARLAGAGEGGDHARL
jgi:hypothetical protein